MKDVENLRVLHQRAVSLLEACGRIITARGGKPEGERGVAWSVARMIIGGLHPLTVLMARRIAEYEAAEASPPTPRCGSTADNHGVERRCILRVEHAGPHRAVGSAGQFSWS